MHVQLDIKIFNQYVSAHGTHNKVLSSETCHSQYLFFLQSDSADCTSIYATAAKILCAVVVVVVMLVVVVVVV